MNRFTWRQLASGLFAATLSLGIAACDDDTSGSGDMGVGADMSASVDMTMTTGTPGTGQLVLADLVGTVFSPSLPSGAAPQTHTLLALASLPATSGTSDPSSDLNLTDLLGLHDQSLHDDEPAGRRRRRRQRDVHGLELRDHGRHQRRDTGSNSIWRVGESDHVHA